MSKERWFAFYEARINEFMDANDGEWPSIAETDRIVEQATDDLMAADATRADLISDHGILEELALGRAEFTEVEDIDGDTHYEVKLPGDPE